MKANTCNSCVAATEPAPSRTGEPGIPLFIDKQADNRQAAFETSATLL